MLEEFDFLVNSLKDIPNLDIAGSALGISRASKS
jgi:hypothetical protein